MAINLDEIVAGSNSVEDIVKALTAESESASNASKQMMSVADAAVGSLNPLNWIKGVISPKSTAGTFTTDQAYKKHYTDSLENGEEPLSKEDFIKEMERIQKESSSKKTKA